MNESTQIIELLNNENSTFTNISYKSVNRTKINNMNNNSFSNNKIRFNTKELANHLVSYQDAYILLEVDIKFAEEANALPANIRLKNSYEMVNSVKIELNRTIISNEDYIYYSNMIPHLLENSKNDDLLYRGIDLHNNAQCDHFQQFYNWCNVKVHVPIIRWSHCVMLLLLQIQIKIFS